MLLFIICALIPAALTRLLQVNSWHSFSLAAGQKASLDLSIFSSCDSFPVVFSSPRMSHSLLRFSFDASLLETVDVLSVRNISVPSTLKVIGGCREYYRKPPLTLNISSYQEFFELRVDGQVIRRPKLRYSEQFQILLPQDVPCCLIRAMLLTDNDVHVTTPRSAGFKPSGFNTVDLPFETTTPTEGSGWDEGADPEEDDVLTGGARPTRHWQLITLHPPEATGKPTASSHEYQLYSWTDYVNREWSGTFLFCAYLTSTIMFLLVLFGILMFICLQTKPKGAKKLYAVHT